MREKRFFKFIEPRMSDGDNGNGQLTGYIMLFNSLNSHGEVSLPGCTAATRAQFLENGFNADSHNWDSFGGLIGYPTSIIEDARGVLATFSFHSTQAAQDARTVASERIAAGMSVGLSIGFSWNDDAYYIYPSQYKDKLAPLFNQVNRADLLQQATSQFSRVRVLPTVNLYEYSLVTVPSQPKAMATQVRSAQKIKLIRSECPLISKCMEKRGEYLGDDICGYISLDALSTLYNALMYGALGGWSGGILFDDGDTYELKMEQVHAALQEFSILAEQIIGAIMQFDDANDPDNVDNLEASGEIALAARAMFGKDPAPFLQSVFQRRGAKLGMRLSDHSAIVLEAITGFKERIDSMKSFRKGAELSKENLDTLKTHRDAAKAVADGLSAMIEKCDDTPNVSTASADKIIDAPVLPATQPEPTASVATEVVSEETVNQISVASADNLSAKNKHLQDRMRLAGIQ